MWPMDGNGGLYNFAGILTKIPTSWRQESHCLWLLVCCAKRVEPCSAMSRHVIFHSVLLDERSVSPCADCQQHFPVFQFIDRHWTLMPWFLHDPNAEATWVSLCSFLHGITGVSLMCCTVSKRGLTCRAAEKDLPPRCLSRAGKCFTSKATRWRSTVCSWDLSKLLLVCLFSQPVFTFL